MRPWLWAGLFVICGAAAVYILAFVIGLPRSEAFVEYNLERLETYAAAGPGEPNDPRRVILLGNSRFKYATLDGEKFGRLASAAVGGAVHVIGIFNNRAVFEDFAPLAESILHMRPDAILLQVEMLAWSPFELGLLGVETSLRYFRWQLVGSGPWQRDAENPWEVQYDRPCENDFSKKRFQHRLQFPQEINLMGVNADLARSFLRRAVDEGIEIILIPVPKSPRLEKFRPSIPSVMEDLIEDVIVSSERVDLWRYPGEVPAEGYCDFLHMNENGRALFSSWLVSRLASL